MMWDVAILGGGAAGCTAALYAARAGLSAVLLERSLPGGQLNQTTHIENYPGIPETDGLRLAENMHDMVISAGAEVKICNVTSADGMQLNTTDGSIQGRTLIIATGARHRQLGLANEERLTGRGVSYCASCDGMLFRNKVVAVVGGGNTAAQEALTLSRICKKVFLIHRRDRLRAEEAYALRLAAAENVEFIWNSQVTALHGDDVLTGLRIRNNIGEEQDISVDGSFVCIGMQPETALFRDKLALDQSGYIIADESCRTSVPGIFAAGDVRTKEVRQIVTAVADGAVCVHQAQKFLERI